MFNVIVIDWSVSGRPDLITVMAAMVPCAMCCFMLNLVVIARMKEVGVSSRCGDEVTAKIKRWVCQADVAWGMLFCSFTQT